MQVIFSLLLIGLLIWGLSKLFNAKKEEGRGPIGAIISLFLDFFTSGLDNVVDEGAKQGKWSKEEGRAKADNLRNVVNSIDEKTKKK